MEILKKYLRFIILISILFFLFGVNSYAQTTYDWLGTASSGSKTDWTNPLNWRSTNGGVVTNPATDYPGHVGSTDIVDIGVNVGFYIGVTTPEPKINSGATINIASLNMGDNLPPVGSQYTITLTVNGTLNITNAFTQMHSTVGTAGSGGTTTPNYTRPIFNYLLGSGTMTCGSFTVGDSTVPTASGVLNVTGFKIGGGSLINITVNGDFTVNSAASKDGSNNIISENLCEFSFSSGTLNIYGKINVTDVAAPYVAPYSQYSPLSWFSMDLYNNADSPVLNLYNATPVFVQTGSNRNSVDFYNINAAGGTGTTTVNYAATSSTQDVPIYLLAGATMYKFIDPNPSVYQNVTFSGAGTKSVTPTAGTFSVAGNFTLAAGTETVDISTNNPILTIGGNYSSASGTTLLKSNASALTIPGTTSNGGTFTHSGGATITFTGAFTNTATGTYSMTAGGTFTAGNTTNNAGIFNQSGTALATFTGAVTNTGTINQTNTGNILFSAVFTNSGSSSVLKQTGTGTITFSNTLTNGGTVTQGGGPISVAGTVTNTGTLTLGSANFTFTGDYSNTGTFTAGTGTAIFSGTTTQHMTDGSSAGTVFNNCLFSGDANKNMQSGSFYVSSTGIMTLSGTNTHVVPTAANDLTFLSDANGSATLAALPNNCTINGSVTVQRYVAGGLVSGATTRGYRLVSSPVYETTDSHSNNIYSINYLANSTYISGTNFPTAGTTKAGNPSLYLYRENLAPLYTTFINSNYRGISDISGDPNYQINTDGGPFNIPVGNGYLFFFRGGLTTVNPFTTTSIPANATLAATGTLNQGNVNVTNWYNAQSGAAGLLYSTASGDVTIEGMNLVGNPYPSTIDWNTFSSSNASAGIYGPGLTGTIYLLNPPDQIGAGTYGSYIQGVGGTNNATNLIASGVGFFVQASGTGASLKFTENAKVSTQVTSPALFMANKATLTSVHQAIRLVMKLDSINTDEILINFNANAKPAYNILEDAHYRTGTGKVNLASLSSDNQALAINQLPLALKGDTIKLKVGAVASGNYTLNLKSITGIPQIYDVWLKDALTKDSVNLRTTASYSFTLNTTDTTTFGANRFSLMIIQDPALAYKLLSFDATKAGNNNKQVQLTWKTQNEQNYTNFAVERSNDNGKTFEVIGSMLSSGVGSYSLLDKDPLKDANLYRLKQVDFNNTISYSNVVEVDFNGNNNIAGHLNCYPNPAFTNIHLSFDPKNPGNISYDVKVTNSSGMIVRYAVITEPNWQANVSNLLTGTYLIQVTDKKDNSVVGQAKFVKL